MRSIKHLFISCFFIGALALIETVKATNDPNLKTLAQEILTYATTIQTLECGEQSPTKLPTDGLAKLKEARESVAFLKAVCDTKQNSTECLNTNAPFSLANELEGLENCITLRNSVHPPADLRYIFCETVSFVIGTMKTYLNPSPF